MAWFTGSSMNSVRAEEAAAGNSLNSGIVFRQTAEKWNGTSWSTVAGPVNHGTYLGGCGKADSALAVGGDLTGSYSYINLSSVWNGSSWSTTTSFPSVIGQQVLLGNTIAALSVGGRTSSSRWNRTYVLRGSAWATTTNLTQVKMYFTGVGEIYNALVFGNANTTSSSVEMWNGMTWSTRSRLTVERHGLSSLGTVSDCIALGGKLGTAGATTNTVERWQGSSWSITDSLSIPKRGMQRFGGIKSGVVCGGRGASDSYIADTELWKINTISGEVQEDGEEDGYRKVRLYDMATGNLLKQSGYIGAWTITTDRNTAGTARSQNMCGTVRAALFAFSNIGEKWDGSSWATTGTIARSLLQGSHMCGTEHRALSTGGCTSTWGNATNAVEIWDGAAWSTTSNMVRVRHNHSSMGKISQCLAIGGTSSAGISYVDLFLGATWASSTRLPVALYATAQYGIRDGGAVFGGSVYSHYYWNGSAWSTLVLQNVHNRYMASAGNPKAAISFGGYVRDDPKHTAVYISEKWNGSSWSTVSGLNVHTSELAGCGFAKEALKTGGQAASDNSWPLSTEIWNEKTSTFVFDDLGSKKYTVVALDKRPEVSLEFDGINSNVTVPLTSMLAGNEITFELWNYGVGIQHHNSVIYSEHSNFVRNLNIHLPDGTNIIHFDCGISGTTYDRISKACTLEDLAGWHHWAFTKNVSTGVMSIYRDGELWHSGTGLTRPITDPAGSYGFILLGNTSLFGALNLYRGKISEVRIWSTARTQQEIQDNMHSRIVGPQSGLVSCWPMVGGGNIIQDVSGNGNHGTANACEWSDKNPFTYETLPMIKNDLIFDNVTGVWK